MNRPPRHHDRQQTKGRNYRNPSTSTRHGNKGSFQCRSTNQWDHGDPQNANPNRFGYRPTTTQMSMEERGLQRHPYDHEPHQIDFNKTKFIPQTASKRRANHRANTGRDTQSWQQRDSGTQIPGGNSRDSYCLTSDTLKKFDDSFDAGQSDLDLSGQSNPNIIRWSKHQSMSPETPPNPFAAQKPADRCRPEEAVNERYREEMDEYSPHRFREDDQNYPYHTGPQRVPRHAVKREQQRFKESDKWNDTNQALFEEPVNESELNQSELEDAEIQDFKIAIDDSMVMDDEAEGPQDEHAEAEPVEEIQNLSEIAEEPEEERKAEDEPPEYGTLDAINEALANLAEINEAFAELSDGVKAQESEIKVAAKRVSALQRDGVRESETDGLSEGEAERAGPPQRRAFQQDIRRPTTRRATKRKFNDVMSDDGHHEQNWQKRPRIG